LVRSITRPSGVTVFPPSFPPGPLINPFSLCVCCFPPPLRSRASLCGGCSSSFRCPHTAAALPLRGLRAAARDKERVIVHSGGKEGGKPAALRFTQPSLRWPPYGRSMALTKARAASCLYSRPPLWQLRQAPDLRCRIYLACRPFFTHWEHRGRVSAPAIWDMNHFKIILPGSTPAHPGAKLSMRMRHQSSVSRPPPVGAPAILPS
jgi:hypothetical protein